MKQTLRLIAISAFAAAAASVPAFAEPATGPAVTIVNIAGLDLSSATGRAELDHRLVAAAYEVCGTPSDADLVGKNQARACRTDVLAKARADSAQLASRDIPLRMAAAC